MECLCEQLAGPQMLLAPGCIGEIWIFKNLDRTELLALSQMAVRRKISNKQSLFLQGDPASEMFLIKAGRVRLSKVLEDGTELTIDFRKAGDCVGENMLTEEMTYPFSAWCMEDCLTCGFTREIFEALVTEHPGIGLQIIRNMSERIAWLTNQVGSISVTSIEDRLYGVLINLAKSHGKKYGAGLTLQFPLTHEDLGFLIGAHRVSITRALSSLKKAGKIIVEGKIIVLPCSAA